MKKKTLLPIALLAVGLAMAACGTKTDTSSNGGASDAPTTSEVPTPASSSSSEDTTKYGVEISNKTDFADGLKVGGEDKKLSLSLTPAGNPTQLVGSGDLVVTSNNTSVASVSGLYVHPVAEGTATITVTYKNATDSVIVKVEAEAEPTPIADIIKSCSKGDKIKFRGIYLGNTTMGAATAVDDYAYVYVDDGTGGLVLYNASKSQFANIAVGDAIEVNATYSPFNGLPETGSGTSVVKKLDDSYKQTITPRTSLTFGTDSLTTADVNRRIDIADAEIKSKKSEAKSHTYTADGSTKEYKDYTINLKKGTSEIKFVYSERYCGECEAITNAQVGDKLSFNSFVYLNNSTISLYNAFNVTLSAVPHDPIESIEVSGSSKIYTGDSTYLSVSVSPATAINTVTWASADETIATVTADGKVTGVKAGTVTITATSTTNTEVYKNFVIQVVEKPTEIVHSGTEEDPYSVDDAVLYTNKLSDKTPDTKEIWVTGVVLTSTYSSEYKNYTIWLEDSIGGKAFEIFAGVFAEGIDDSTVQDENGMTGCTITVHGYAEKFGTTLELTKNGGSYPTITKISSVANSITLDKTEANVKVGSTTTLVATLGPTFAVGTVTWTSSDQEVATVADGVVTGVKAGTATITAALSETIKAECSVTVTEDAIHATSVTIQETASVLCWESTKLTWSITDGCVETAALASSDTTIVTVDAEGNIKGLKAGTATITITASNYVDDTATPNLKASCTVTVEAFTEHEGTLEDPLSASDAKIAATKYSSGSSKTYFIKGHVTKIKNAFSSKYGDVGVWIADEADGKTETFLSYKMSGIEGKKLLTSKDVEVGDLIVFKAAVCLYDETPETNGTNELVSITKANASKAIELNQTTASVETGGTVDLSGVVGPTTGTDLGSDKITWTVDQGGTLSATSGNKVTFTAGSTTGTATVTASWKETEDSEPITATCVITITAPVTVVTTLDFTKKTASHNAYNDSWDYGDWTIAGAANNNGKWDYVKVGGKSEKLLNDNNFKSKNVISESIGSITVKTVDGSIKETGMSASVKVEAYSDSAFKTKVGETNSATIAAKGATYTLTPTSGAFASGLYYKVAWTIGNTSIKTNGVVCVASVAFNAAA